MNLEEFNQRLQILLDQDIITNESRDVAVKAFEQFINVTHKTDIDHAEMLFTHLPMALTRMEMGEKVEPPTADLMREVEELEHFQLAKEQVTSIEKLWGKPLPQGEKEYLYMHYTTVLNSNL
ncbi:PRD domain-containing protein [Lentibacillus sp. L22]|uniref:PRD domain-containing protein n=1 Tax=Lentibacillus sp. L22 TaxID=3163028 RepID=UPI003467D7D1